MKIKAFEALTLKDCLSQVRHDLGPEAVILETRKTRKGGILGWGARDAVRIVAGTGIVVNDEDRPAARRRSAEPVRAAVADTINPPAPQPALRRDAPDIAAFLARHAAESRKDEAGPDNKLEKLESDVLELKQALRSLGTPSAEAGDPHAELRQRLRDADVPEELISELLNSLGDAYAEGDLRDAMIGRIQTAGLLDRPGSGPRVVALIGPTGVGKTTTIAKLAAQAALIEKKRVGLITMDTYRIAAVEQLRSYAQIIGIPVEVVHNQGEIAPALARLKECDLILIDTAGRSQKNVMQVSELKSLVDAAKCETHLVLAASTRERDLLDQAERFGGAGVDRILFTKLDETTTYGTLFSVAAKTNTPVSYLATGQKVPEDIEVATTEAIVDRILLRP